MEMKHLSAEIKAAKGDGAGSFEAILSMPTLDRDGEIIDADAFLPLPKKITIDVDHGLSAEKTIGSGVPFYDGDVLKVRGTFASTPLAQQIRTLVLEEHLGHMSVAYRAAQYENDEKDGFSHLRKGELINAAIVGIPANREAAILVAKAAATAKATDEFFIGQDGSVARKVGARNAAKDLERLQATHDHMVELGAQCTMKHAHDIEPFKSGGLVGGVGTYVLTAGEHIVLPSGAIGVVTKSSDEDPDGKAAAPAAVSPPAPQLMANAYAALAKARMLQLDL